MSDLFCPATVIVARHGEAEYDSDHVSDDGGSLTVAGRSQAMELAESLRGRRVAAVWCSDMARSVQTAEIVAGVLSVPVRVRPGLREFSVGGLAGLPDGWPALDAVFARWMAGDLAACCPGAESGVDVVR
ncbi:MAG: histidine phosphatase family protein, partial [Nocardioidaceae bacterium]